MKLILNQQEVIDLKDKEISWCFYSDDNVVTGNQIGFRSRLVKNQNTDVVECKSKYNQDSHFFLVEDGKTKKLIPIKSVLYIEI